MMNNKAAWLPAAHAQLEVREAPDAELGEHDVLIESKAVAINPVDWKIQDYGAYVTKYPAILGEDVAGVVAQTGSSVAKVKRGDRVLAHCLSLHSLNYAQSAFQKYTVVPEITVSPIPSSVSYEQAAVVPLGLSTAAAALYQKEFLNLPYPKPGPPVTTGTSILVWGGSSSVGGNAIQLAVASGVQVIATCSTKNFGYVKDLGASHVFDYNETSVVDDIVKSMSGSKFVGALDAISQEKTYKATAAVVKQLGGGLIAGTVPVPDGLDLAKDMNAKAVFALTIAFSEPEVGKAIYQDFLPAALESGQFKAKPEPEVKGHGLESIQGGMDALKKGVSASKVVITL